MAKVNAPGATTDQGAWQDIEALRQRYSRLERKKIETSADLRNAEQQLDELKREAKAKYGTDDLAELKTKLEEMKAENEKKCREYQQQLDQIEGDLAKVEQAFNQAADGHQE
jgi:DNA repair exonuclease SbcCD ATPase subunit